MTKLFSSCALTFALLAFDVHGEVQSLKPESMLATAKASPQAVEAHDRRAWLELFTDKAQIEDPVGAPRLQRQGRSDPIFSRFYETFMASTQIQFIGHGDYFSGSTILRDVDIRTDISSECGVTVPAFVSYDIQAVSEGPRIAALRAYWELSSNVTQLAAHPLACAGPSWALSQRMLRELGASYSLGYSKALVSVGSKGQAVLRDMIASMTEKNRTGFLKHFSQAAQVDCSPDGSAQTPEEFWEDGQRSQLIWAADSKMLSAGRNTLGHVQWMNQESSQDTVIQLSFDQHKAKVVALRCYFPIPEPF
ncbi:MAG TPA: hypothetical protein VFO10_13370 [Oligoflexus sp.]|uniref:hypothetical protein n=1 Tax=Oligoflexus sp. TaxID=1971216 RepID=UPI002D80C869|nr:hypothetical protein [Oligoflexus sp.]HET9238244.1 hypothetical protein [Oligoflexus sp.]